MDYKLLREDLKQQTHAEHIRLEKRIVTYIKKVESVEDYTTLLKGYLGFIKPLEERIAQFIGVDQLPDVEQRMRAPVLHADLIALQADTDGVLFCTELPYIQDVATAAGALYVLEGSTMGGPYIKAMLQKRLDVNSGLRYFEGYGEQNREMFGKFLAILDAPEVVSRGVQVVEAARETFEKFDSHLAAFQAKGSYATP